MNVLLVDGSAMAYRAYFAFARNPLLSSKGEPTSVPFAFLSTLLRWMRRFEPRVAAVVFDSRGPTHRHAIDPEYKAHRPPRPEGLVEQLPRLHEVLGALCMPVIEVEGWEADDVLATLVRHFEAQGAQVFLASGDKDFRQLLDARVRLVRPQLGAGDDDVIGPEELMREVGVAPQQIVDLMALCGDPVDNVHGVPGVGEKTAAELVRTYGSLDGLYARLDEVARPALRQKLAAHRAVVEQARELVRLRTDVPIDCDARVPTWSGPDWPRLRVLLRELELVQLLRWLPASAAPVTEDFQDARSDEDVEALATRLAGLDAVALDLEPRHAPSPGFAALGLAWADGAAGVEFAGEGGGTAHGQLALDLDAGHGVSSARVFEVLGPRLAAPRLRIVGVDLKRSLRAFGELGIEVPGPRFDVGVASYVLHPERHRHDLEALVLEHLDTRLPESERAPAARRAAARARAIWQLHGLLGQELAASGLERLFEEVEMPLVAVLADMEAEGIRVDVELLSALSREIEARSATLATSIQSQAGRSFNLQSTQQLGQVLFGELKLPHGRRTRNGWSTDVDVLERLAPEHEIARALLEYRQITKLRSTYCDTLPRLVHPRTGRIHTTFHQTVASTGRLSSSDPNLQNIPIRSELGRRIRAAFVPRDTGSRLVSADYSQIELRLLAHLSGDPALVAAFEQRGDVHTLTAARIAGCDPRDVTPEQRAAAKTVNFGMIYGMGPRGLAERLGLSLDAARRFIDDYFASYPEVRRCTQELVQQARATGYATTLLGRRLALPELRSSQPGRRSAAERVAVNAPIQGSAADLVKIAMIRVHARLREVSAAARLVLQVHDELVLDVPEDEVESVVELVRHEMQGALELRVPVEVDVGVGADWAEAH